MFDVFVGSVAYSEDLGCLFLLKRIWVVGNELMIDHSNNDIVECNIRFYNRTEWLV